MKHHLFYLTLFLLALTLCLSACGSISLSSVAQAQTAQGTATPELMNVPVPIENKNISTVEEFLESYLAGESIDVRNLSPAEFREFSSRLAERRNAERGINPIIFNNDAYVSPDNYMMLEYADHPDLNETIKMYLPIAGKDGRGNLQIVNHTGEIVTIDNSADVDWNMVVTDPNDPRIDWPKTKVLESGYVEAQYRVVSLKNPTHLIPAILIDNRMGQLFLQGNQPAVVPSLRFLIIETDNANNPILAREILNIGGPKFNLFEEGSSLDEESEIIAIPTSNTFFENLQVNYVYYIGGPTDQTEFFNNTMRANIDSYRGIIDPGKTYLVLKECITNYKEMLILATSVIIKS